MLVELMGLFAAGELTPLPVSSFGLDDVVGAFRFMAQARHVGKVVVGQPLTDRCGVGPTSSPAASAASASRSPAISPRAGSAIWRWSAGTT